MNPLSDKMQTGTLGELLVQLRLLQYDVQAAPPLKDTGNDLIALRGTVVKAIQIKTGRHVRPRCRTLRRKYDIQALVTLTGEGRDVWLDDCEIVLVPREDLPLLRRRERTLDDYKISAELVDRLFDLR